MPRSVPARVGDMFLVALSAMMLRSGQGEHISASILALSRAPQPALVRSGLTRLLQKHPLLTARLRRNRTWLPFWESRDVRDDESLPFGLWREAGSPGVLGAEAREVKNADEHLLSLRHEPLPADFHARFDLVERADGSCLAALSWGHLLLDGKGAELLFADLARLCDGVDESCEAPEPPVVKRTLAERIARTKPAIRHLGELAQMRIRSLAEGRTLSGRSRQQLITFAGGDAARVRSRVEQTSGALFPLAFFAAAATRAHDRVLAHRGTLPDGYVASVPIQTRKRGARGPVFHNNVTVFFFGSRRGDLDTLPQAAGHMKQQFAEMSRARLDESFTELLTWMTRLPEWLFMKIVRWQMRGEFCSFFHSHTGSFAPELTHFAGAEISNAWHFPCMSAPPGSGIFVGEHGDKLNVTLSWSESCLSDDERRVMVASLIEDLLGEPRPDLVDAQV